MVARLIVLTVFNAVLLDLTAQTSKYILVDQSLNHADAQLHCQREYGSDLASIHSNEDNNAAQDLCRIGGLSCWIGLTDIEQEGSFVWKDGTVFDYGGDVSGGVYPWGGVDPKGDPNNGGVENCVELRVKSDYNWNDNGCSGQSAFLCNACNPTCSPTATPTGSPTDIPTPKPTKSPTSVLTSNPSANTDLYVQTNPPSIHTTDPTSVSIEATLREAVVDETEETIESTRQPDQEVTETESHSWRLLIIVACSATVCCCCVAAAILRCVELARQASKRKLRNGAQNGQQAAQLQIEFAALPLHAAWHAAWHAAPNVQALRAESDVESEERNEDIDAAHAFANQVQPVVARSNGVSILSNRPEGLPRAPIIAQPTAGGLPADVYHVHANTTSDVLELINLEEDEFEVVDDSVFHVRNSVFH